MANLITGLRVVLAFALLPLTTFSVPFNVVYILCGLTDAADGIVARRLGTASEFGAEFDTAADMVFFGAFLIKFYSVFDLKWWIVLWIILIAFIKTYNIFILFRKNRALFPHTAANKIAGAVLFVFPFVQLYVDVNLCAGVICAVCTFAAVRETLAVKDVL